MDGSRTIRVLKRDGSVEEFNQLKLAGAIWRALAPRGQYREAVDLSAAIGLYLERALWTSVSSAAVFEMTIRVLRRVGMDDAAKSMETFRFSRGRRRRLIKVAHLSGQVTFWQKDWLSRLGAKYWSIARSTARIIAGQVERELLAGPGGTVTRVELVERFNTLVSEYGLADAVPVNGLA